MEAKVPTEDIAAKASMEEAALLARTEWEAVMLEAAFRVEAPVMLAEAVMLEAAFRVEVPVMLAEAVMLEAAFRVEAAFMVVAGVMLEAAAAVTTEH
jgi:hypothetical protein